MTDADGPDAALDLDRRTGWPDDLRLLIARYPREVWPTHPNLGELSKFWLGRHDMFRELNGALLSASDQLKAGTVPAEAFRQWFLPRIRFFLQQLEGHHMIEDHEYFPLLTRTEPRLARGFDILENDHEAIHAGLLALQEAGGGLARALTGPPDRIGFAAEAMSDTLSGFLTRLHRHLDDEEDLIIPILLDRGEMALGG
ncbi:hemerythrin domain-containing protein [Microbaculum marinisediminis]|uniref:Hemerythrin domain-containing protein n=1 Tax=Microbaculum marinisediminis TaxID=2931392 RepID=A0AAW5R3R2_9HYPH|nr:hemerythrin domain-containing protein [Microbaculum sp. A6E488]MCT8974895.1 hemerythrin domain-containing protein [Microbaculum sp. A6E488]